MEIFKEMFLMSTFLICLCYLSHLLTKIKSAVYLKCDKNFENSPKNLNFREFFLEKLFNSSKFEIYFDLTK